jgi:hypothetical protein
MAEQKTLGAVLGMEPVTGIKEPPTSQYPIPKSKKKALEIIGGMSSPGKMPEGSYSISAWDCKTGNILRQTPGSVCSGCYAQKGNYLRYKDHIKEAHDRHLGLINLALNDENFRKHYVGGFVKALEGTKHFRWHDAGDIQSPEHLGLINEIALATPNTKHWLPTKEAAMYGKWKKAGNEEAPNLVVRGSAPMVDEEMGNGKLFNNTSSVHKMKPPSEGSYSCPSPHQGGKCDGTPEGGVNCRACWDKNTKNVSYGWH